MALIIDWIGGNCPVQAEGTFDNNSFYFRARWEHWTLTVGCGTGEDSVFSDPIWNAGEKYGGGDPYAAGWMSEEEAMRLIRACYDKWLLGGRGGEWPGPGISGGSHGD